VVMDFGSLIVCDVCIYLFFFVSYLFIYSFIRLYLVWGTNFKLLILQYLHPSFTSFLLGTDILLRTLFSHNRNVSLSLGLRDQNYPHLQFKHKTCKFRCVPVQTNLHCNISYNCYVWWLLSFNDSGLLGSHAVLVAFRTHFLLPTSRLMAGAFYSHQGYPGFFFPEDICVLDEEVPRQDFFQLLWFSHDNRGYKGHAVA
jgi:hypothetical protein